jgi:hypothetical protein
LFTPISVSKGAWSGYAASILPELQLEQSPTVGMYGGTLYDILPENTGIGNVTVNTTTMDVSCGLLPKVTVAGNKNNTTWKINSSYDGINSSIAVPSIGETVNFTCSSYRCRGFQLTSSA